MPSFSTAVLLALGVQRTYGQQSPVAYTCAGSFNVSFQGESQAWKVITASSSWEHVTANGSTVSIAYNDRAYLVSDCAMPGGTFAPSLYAKRLPMLGQAWSFTMDVSTASCGCNAALYAVSMPGVAADGSPSPSSGGDYYCDANKVGGTWCTEMDLIEANTAAMAATPHSCDPPDANGFVPKCDKGGCGLGTKSNSSLFGPGAAFTIDTRRPFDVTTSYPVDSQGSLAAVTTLVNQGEASFTLNHTPGGCRSHWAPTMTEALAGGMVPTFSLWGDKSSGGDMTWLDSPPCSASQGCGGDGTIALFSNFAVTAL
jgi:hypothetical protein